MEKECQRSNDYIENFQKYDYIIADECHYFLEDSIFNTDTKFSYDWIFHRKSHTVLIFISATIERIKEYVIQDQKLPVEKSVEERKKGPRVCRGDLDINDIVRTYNIEPDYSYLNLELLKNTQEIVEYVQKESKWLIFVDSIKRGKEIKSLLDKSLQKESETSRKRTVVFIDADSKNEEEGADIVKYIGNKECFKREDTERLNVYILLRDKKDFERFLSTSEKQVKFKTEFSGQEDKLLEKIMKSEFSYQCARKLCFVKEASLIFNELAVKQWDYLYQYYQKIVDRFECEGGTAFLKEQLEWIGCKNIEEECKKLMQSLLGKMCEVIENYKGKVLSEEDRKAVREKIRLDIVRILKSCDVSEEKDKKVIKGLIEEYSESSDNRPLTKKFPSNNP